MLDKVYYLKGSMPKDVVDFLLMQFTMMHDCMETTQGVSGFVDPTVGSNNFSWYGSLPFETSLEYFRPLFEKTIGKDLHPTYSYGRIYGNDSYLNKHMDRQSSQWSASCCLSKDCDWPISFEHEGVIKTFEMEPGDMVLFPGSSIVHYRNRYKGQKHVQFFLQYVEQESEYSHLKYDTRPCLASSFELVDQSIKDELNRQVYTPPEEDYDI